MASGRGNAAIAKDRTPAATAYNIMANGYRRSRHLFGFTPYHRRRRRRGLQHLSDSRPARATASIGPRRSETRQASSNAMIRRSTRAAWLPNASTISPIRSGAGVNYEFSRNAQVDLGYEYSAAPTGTICSISTATGARRHQRGRSTHHQSQGRPALRSLVAPARSPTEAAAARPAFSFAGRDVRRDCSGGDKNYSLDAERLNAYRRPWATPPQRGARYLEG